jgi:hypothetical protein
LNAEAEIYQVQVTPWSPIIDLWRSDGKCIICWYPVYPGMHVWWNKMRYLPVSSVPGYVCILSYYILKIESLLSKARPGKHMVPRNGGHRLRIFMEMTAVEQ